MYNSCNQRVNSIYTLTTSEETMDQCYHISASTEKYHRPLPFLTRCRTPQRKDIAPSTLTVVRC